MIVITVARKPLSEANVAANVLKHGCGAVNVNACRIATADDLNGGAYSPGGAERHDGAENWRYKRGEQGGLAGVGFVQPLGRWPANLILAHRDGCRLTGTRTVRSDGHYPGARPKGSEVSGPSGHAGQEGLTERYTDGESISVWKCAEGCPVAALDAQSQGAASRYFKQVGGKQ